MAPLGPAACYSSTNSASENLMLECVNQTTDIDTNRNATRQLSSGIIDFFGRKFSRENVNGKRLSEIM